MSQADHVKTICISTADEFLRVIALNGPRYGGSYYPHELYFRGHANHQWLLLPGILREGTLLGVGKWSRTPQSSNRAQIELEAESLFEFAELANRSGLFVPQNTGLIRHPRESIEQLLNNPHVQWPPDELLPLAALAQHSGLASRLLDWTRNPYVAAYFAAAEAATWLWKTHSQLRKGATHLCVWVITASLFELRKFVRTTPPRISPVITPYATNANMRAQKGLFLFDRPADLDLSAPVDLRPWDKLIEEDADWLGEPKPDQPFGMLDRICLPVEEAGRLLRLLSFEGIDAASLFPDYSGVVDAVDQRRFWEPRYAYDERNERLTSDRVSC